MRRAFAALLLLALPAGGLAAVPSRHEILQAISVLEKDVSGPDAVEAARTIVNYAQESDDVMVDIGPDQVPWVNEKWGLGQDKELACQSMLFAAFVAGNVRSQLRSARAENDSYSGWVFAISTYRKLRGGAAFRSPAIESLSKMEADGTLLQHAREVQRREDEDSEEPERKPFT